MNTVNRYGFPSYTIGLLHGGPGAAGELKVVAKKLSSAFGVLELIQTKKSVNAQIEELFEQLNSFANFPVILIGYSWGAWLGFLFASRYPELVKKLILLSAGAFERKYNMDLMKIRFERLTQSERTEAESLFQMIKNGNKENNILNRFGKLMSLADTYEILYVEDDGVNVDMEIHQSVWKEAAKLRDTGQLLDCAKTIECPVVAIHGDYDSHPVKGVEEPLSKRLKRFKMITLEKCGHTPWKEKFAKDKFFTILEKELVE
ncbi:MAG: alpha/beta hydrolase [Bacteroidales bacterium]|nr:alpha/beta hydrolase [Bacteroidales bacterium]